jgi:branched-subunit amino acid aminotransferase/4-amino-4-deoxychorismate lyase
MKVPYDQATLEQAQIDVVRENKLASCYLRPLIWIVNDEVFTRIPFAIASSPRYAPHAHAATAT